MVPFLFRRLILLIPTWLLVAVIAFLVIHLAPGDPASVLLGQEGLEAAEEARRRMGLDQPLHMQLWLYLKGLVRGDLGDSYFLGVPVLTAIKNAAPVTIGLSVLALVIAFIIGVPLGIAASLNPDTPADSTIMLIALIGLSIPEFVLGLVLILIFSVTYQIFPAGGYQALSTGFRAWFTHLLLPAFALGFMQSAYLARMTRASMLEVLHSDYIRTAHAKGIHERKVIVKHAFRNAAIPIITAVGLVFAMLLSGAFITEALFRLPGIGTLVINAVSRRDYPVVQGSLIIIATAVLVVNMIVDLVYALVDPRIRYG